MMDGYDDYYDDYLMFPEDYCRGCEGGAGPYCEECLIELEAELEMDLLDREEGWS
jgi:hypothetical protein